MQNLSLDRSRCPGVVALVADLASYECSMVERDLKQSRRVADIFFKLGATLQGLMKL